MSDLAEGALIVLAIVQRSPFLEFGGPSVAIGDPNDERHLREKLKP